GYKGIKELKDHHQPLEKAYFSFINGMYHHTLQDYQKSDSLLNAALPHIKENNDFAMSIWYICISVKTPGNQAKSNRLSVILRKQICFIRMKGLSTQS